MPHLVGSYIQGRLLQTIKGPDPTGAAHEDQWIVLDCLYEEDESTAVVHPHAMYS